MSQEPSTTELKANHWKYNTLAFFSENLAESNLKLRLVNPLIFWLRGDMEVNCEVISRAM